jgi:carbamoyltransferase
MYILGINCYYHDAAACLLKDGIVVAAAQEERFTRVKHDASFPQKAIDFCLDLAEIKAADLDYVVFGEKPFLKFERILKTIFSVYPRSWALFQEAVTVWMSQKLWIKSTIEEKLGIHRQKILFCEHHVSHAASSFFCSPFSEAAILTCDGVGEWATTTLGRASADWDGHGKNDMELFKEIKFPHSLGLLYSVFTAFLGFEVNEGEYKVMGMAAFGEPRHVDKIYKLITVAPDGSFRLDMKYFSYPCSSKKSFNERFEGLFGAPRDPREKFEFSRERDGAYADIAASIQKVCEEILLKMARALYDMTKLKKLCLAGGVALNCVANARILAETPFEEIFIQPASGDSGTAMGAALYVYHVFLSQPRKFVLKHVFLGKEYSLQEIGAAVKNTGLSYRRIEDEAGLLDVVVNALMSGKAVGWFQGRFEWGPRALGHRSILADPRSPGMQDIVNTKIKFREPFRPFAPSVLSSETEKLFDLGKFQGQSPLKFMLLTLKGKKEDMIPAATHADGSSRLQEVEEGSDPLYYRLIDAFFRKTGVPALLNTSFNLKGEPMVNSPEDAISTFLRSGLDMLAMGPFILEKS